MASIEYLPNDAETIRLVAGWFYGEWGHLDPGSSLETAIQRFSGRAGARGIPCTMVARENGLPVGTASLVAEGMKKRPDLTPWLGAVYVLPNWRRRGLGAALCRRMVQEAHAFGFHRVYLYTSDAQHFYRNLGWEEMEQTEYQGEVVTIMTCAP
jgi:GNAT superfamily N-acetyltransferase